LKGTVNSAPAPFDRSVTYLGLDLAWSDRNPSGLAVLDARGRLIDAHANLRTDDDILTWVRANLAADTVLGLDMPTIVNNAAGARACEREVARDFRRYHAGPHPANRGIAHFADGGRARRLLDALAADGVVEDVGMAAGARGRFAFEVFPHPAHVRLFGLDAIFRYKKKPGRPWPAVLAEWSAYRAALGLLRSADPPLDLGDRIPLAAGRTRYKVWDDTLDAITCAYVAAYLRRWGTGPSQTHVYGDTEHGYIVVPARKVIAGTLERARAEHA
jgi:predicted RNase H-like nuclease